MRNLRVGFFFFLVLSTFLFFSCKKENNEAVPIPQVITNYTVSNQLKDYGLFNVGSYWIYRIDSASSLTDSVYVTGVLTNTFSIRETNDSLFVGEKITVYFGCNPNYKDRFYSSISLHSYPYNYITAPRYKEIPFPIFELDSMNIAPVVGGGMVANNSLSNYVLNNVNYGNCRYLSYIYSYSVPSNPPLWYYSNCIWKKNVGLVKNKNSLLYNICDLLSYSVTQ